MTYIGNKDYYLEIAEGNITDTDTVFKFGYNNAVGTTEEVVWDKGGTYTFLTSAETMDIVSNDANDNSAGTGARTMIVQGLDSDYNEIFDVITLTGTTIVTTPKSYLRVFRAYVVTSGTDSPTQDANEGTITIKGTTTSTLQAQINPREGQTLMCVYTVPAGKTAYITGISFGVGKAKECLFRGKFRNGVGGAFSVKFSKQLFESAYTGDLKVPLAVPEKIDMCVTAQNTDVSGTVEADASWGMILVDNEV